MEALTDLNNGPHNMWQVLRQELMQVIMSKLSSILAKTVVKLKPQLEL